MLLPETKSHSRFNQTPEADSQRVVECHRERSFDFEAWETFRNWKRQQKIRFGNGNSAPDIPRSQRQYDGDNSFDYCEVLVLR